MPRRAGSELPWVALATAVVRGTHEPSLRAALDLGLDCCAFGGRLALMAGWMTGAAPDGIVRGPHVAAFLERGSQWVGADGAWAAALVRYDFFSAQGEDLHVGPALLDAGWRVSGANLRARITEADRLRARRAGGSAPGSSGPAPVPAPVAVAVDVSEVASNVVALPRAPSPQPQELPLGDTATLAQQGAARAPRAKAARQGKATPAEPSPFREAVAALCAVFAEVRGAAYLWDGGKDGKALNWLLYGADKPSDDVVAAGPVRPVQEVADLFTRALRHTGYPSVSTVHELRHNANRFVGTTSAASRGTTRAEDYAASHAAAPTGIVSDEELAHLARRTGAHP